MQDSLEKQLVCPICLEVFTKPVVILPCQHNLCRKCANDVFQAANPYMTTRSGGTVTSGGRFRCPSCRHEVVLDRHGVYGLQRNLLVENIIDMMKQGSTSTKPAPEPKVEQPMCEEHAEEKINIYCVSCSVPTCSMCKVFGAHKDCEVAPLINVFQKQKGELTDCISMLVGNNERLQAIITQLEETCRTIDENGRRQKSKVCETFDHLYSILEEKKMDMTLKINADQEEKLDYIRSLRRRYTEHLESMAKVLETGIQTMDQSEMAVFLQDAKPLLQKIIEGNNTSHLEKVEQGYESFDHFTTNFERQRRALLILSFIRSDEEEDEESEEDVAIEGSTALHQPVGSTAVPVPKSPQPPQSLAGTTVPMPKSPQPPQPPTGGAGVPTPRSPQPPLQPTGSSALPAPKSPQPPQAVGSVAFPPLHPSPLPLQAVPPLHPSSLPLQVVAPSLSQHQRPGEGLSATAPVAFPTSQAPSQATASQPQASSDPSGGEDIDGPRHVFSFSWLNQK